MKLLRSFLPIVAFLAFTGAGCDIVDPSDDIAGYYDYAGSVRDEPGKSVNGQLDISRGFGHSEADVDLEWNYYEGGRRVLYIETVRTVPAYVTGSSVEFTVEGRLELSDGSSTDFRLEHDGRREGSRGLRGTWRLVTDLPSDDSGTFTARR